MLKLAGDLIKDCRTEAGMSQQKLAEKAGTFAWQISKWERGINEPRYNIVIACLNAMGYDLELVRLEDE